MRSKRFHTNKKGSSKFRRTKMVAGKRFDFYGQTLSEATAKRDAFVKGNIRSVTGYEGMTFVEGMRIWLYEVKFLDDIKDSTRDRYDVVFRNHIEGKESLEFLIPGLNSRVLQHYVTTEQSNGVSANAVKNALSLMRQFVRFLILEGVLDRDYTKNVKIARDESLTCEERKVFTVEEKKLIREHLQEYPYPLLLELAFETGCRLGELCALTINDLKNGGVYVTKTLTYDFEIEDNGDRKRVAKLKDPKSKNSNRFIPVNAELSERISKAFDLKVAELQKLGLSSVFLFSNSLGKALDKTRVSKSFHELLLSLGIRGKKFHDIRHTFITEAMTSEGANTAVIQRIAGHSDISMTAHYTHVPERIMQDEALRYNSNVGLK